jgi:hypothetical protein
MMKKQEKRLARADKFARCSAIFSITAAINGATGSPNAAKQNENEARGAMFASNYLAAQMGRRNFEVRTESIIETVTTSWMANLEISPETYVQEFTPELSACKENLVFQEAILTMAREEAFDK